MQQAISWNMRCLRSGFGKQMYSSKRTEPAPAMGTAARDAFLKVSAFSSFEMHLGATLGLYAVDVEGRTAALLVDRGHLLDVF
jgi:hypothetical protein